METFLSIAAALGALLIGAISPGPSFVLVARTALAHSRLDGLLAATGMGVGAVIFSGAVLLGLQALLATVPWLYFASKLAGSLFLLYLAIRIWRGAKTPIDLDAGRGIRRNAFALGLLTQLSNPKTAIVYGSIFAALLPHDLPTSILLTLPVLVFLVEAGWYAVVAFTLSAPSSRAAYLRAKVYVDRTAAGVMGALGLRLASASPPV